jgi:hypothetical protein
VWPQVLHEGGLISCLCYTRHDGGMEEYEVITMVQFTCTWTSCGSVLLLNPALLAIAMSCCAGSCWFHDLFNACFLAGHQPEAAEPPNSPCFGDSVPTLECHSRAGAGQ